ncbi:MAG: hypothetical protein HZB09_01150 [Candidatus Yonathbacteria bacterium]|nr:hypothetical protein [Candidatus Yonathbacteria bacterium]
MVVGRIFCLILWAPSSDGSLFPIDKEVMSWFTSVLFLFISLIIIGIKSWKLRKTNKKV